MEQVAAFGTDTGGGDSSTDPERIRILDASPDARCETTSAAKEQQTESKHRESFDDASTRSRTGSLRRKITSEACEPYQMDSSFYNMGFSLSPNDLERSWKQNGPSLSKSNPSDIGRLRRTKSECKISIHRYPIDNSYIDKKCGLIASENSYKKATHYLESRCLCNLQCLLSFITSIIPVLSWLPKYKLEFLIPDIIAGFTIAILHIPQGMAYGVLANVNPENGLYVSFFPVLIYFLLGTSRHISIGTFAVVSLLISSAVHSTGGIAARDTNTTSHNISNTSIDIDDIESWPPTNIEIVTTLAIASGFWQIFMGVFQLGSLMVVLSDQLVSGFTTGAALHVAVSQIKDLFGIHVGSHDGLLKLVYMLVDIFGNLAKTNPATVIASAIAIFVLAFFKEQIDERLKGRLKMPIPIDLIVVVLGTAISYFVNLHKKYEVKIIADIPTGLPYPKPPRMSLFVPLLAHSFAIAVVAYIISLSMAKILSKKHKYSIRPNQELLALGCANVFASFFACYPCSASLSRSVVQERSGGKTQVASIVSCCLLLIVLLALAPLFYSLPKCILSCIILVALKPMFLQVKDFFKAWKISKLDALIWFVTFWATVLLDVTYGLLAGVLFSLITVIFRTVVPTRTFLGRIPDTDIYVDSRRYNLAPEVEGIKIFHFESALYFINKEIFKASLYKHVPPTESDSQVKNPNERIHRIIIDCSSFIFVDMSGLDTLIEVMKEYQEVGISVFLSGCSISMQSVMEKAKFIERVPQHPAIFPTTHDAVEFQFLAHGLGSGS
ncbi:hypothetical protein JTE90_009359 [Oedothorax gibbosus]|uniref:STAS domain-containing protein n=1 Tax=Oedothorax gibbosus TaxID=931172 RepID=A0AAV6VRM6_9ARAC|nr:hypothetical protein JTE90_009359 [Oedothorax gibbosus]